MKFGMLMTPDLAQDVYAGDKTVTRRLLNPQPPSGITGVTETVVDGKICWCFEKKLPDGEWDFWHARPRYKPWAIVAIKETWCRGQVACGDHQLYVSQCKGEDDIIFRGACVKHGIAVDEVKWKSSLHIPFDIARTHVEILDVRPELLQTITGADARREGVTFDVVLKILAEYNTADIRPHHWIHNHPGGEAESYCDECIDAAVEKARKKFPEEHKECPIERDGGYDSPESEGVECCEICGRLLDYVLLEGGIRSELDHFETYGFDYTEPRVASELERIFVEADCIEDADLKDRLYVLGFHILWDSINGKKHPWETNPWVWRYSFKRVEKP